MTKACGRCSKVFEMTEENFYIVTPRKDQRPPMPYEKGYWSPECRACYKQRLLAYRKRQKAREALNV